MQYLLSFCRSPRTLISFAVVFLFFQNFPLAAQSSAGTLRDYGNRADYLIITPSQFVGDLQVHAEWRSNRSWTHEALRTRIVTLEEINKEFGDAVKDQPQSQAEAIRAFLSHTLQFWAEPRPSRVLLVGSTNLLPAYRVKVTIDAFTRPPYSYYEDSIPMDEWYVVNKHRQDFNTRPQAAIGRIPGRTSTEIKRVLSKIRLFEESGNSLFTLSTRATVVLDPDDNEMFDDAVFNFQTFMQYNVKRPLSMATFTASQPNPRKQVTDAMNIGRPIVMYYGHGAPEEWSKKTILTTDDIGNNLLRNGKPFMMITAGCSQNYDIPRKPSIVEAMMLLENGGAVMTLASSGYSNLPENNFFIRLFFKELSTTASIDVGTAILNAKNASYSGGIPPQDNLTRRIALLGDPAMVTFSRLITSVAERPESQATNQFAGGIKVLPNPAANQATLRYTLPLANDVRCDIVNLLGQTVMSLRETQSAGDQSFQITTETLPIGSYLCYVQAGAYRQSIMLTISR